MMDESPRLCENAAAATTMNCSGKASALSSTAATIRRLHESLRELGLDEQVHVAANRTLPDARGRLSYITETNEQAAVTALDAIDLAQPLCDAANDRARLLDHRWQGWYDAPMEHGDAAALMDDTRAYLAKSAKDFETVQSRLVDVLVAQSFQDLTGHVNRKIGEIVQSLEKDLISLLLETLSPDEKSAAFQRVVETTRRRAEASLSDAVQMANPEPEPPESIDQAHVDDLLSALGL